MARAEATIKAAQKWRSCAAVGDYGEALKELDLCKVLVRAAQDAEPRGSEARKRWAVAGDELLESDRLLKGYLAALDGVPRTCGAERAPRRVAFTKAGHDFSFSRGAGKRGARRVHQTHVPRVL